MFLYEIDVKAEYRRQTVGKQLVEALISLCREKGIAEMFVIASRMNHAAMRLYESTGGIPDIESILINYPIDDIKK